MDLFAGRQARAKAPSCELRSGKGFQTDEAFKDLLKKHKQPVALKKSVQAKVKEAVISKQGDAINAALRSSRLIVIVERALLSSPKGTQVLAWSRLSPQHRSLSQHG